MIRINFDGACGPKNPGGRCGGGAVIIKDNEILAEIFDEYIPFNKQETSNNLGEYYGLLKALQFLVNSNLQDETVDVYGDSNLVISQMQGKWRIKNGIYKDIAWKTRLYSKKFKFIRFNWIPREENEWADALSKKAIN